MRTSETHPLQIASIPAGEGLGSVGITFCPGKRQTGAISGAWHRDLDLDLGAAESWGAAAVVSLVTWQELIQLQVPQLGEAVRDRYMTWLHLPIADVSVPSSEFEKHWPGVVETLRAILRGGFNVLFHCKGGLGRAGMVASLLLIEMGWRPAEAVAEVRRVRPGAIETEAQLQYCLAKAPVEEDQRDTSAAAVEDRALGCLLGLAVGDAIGTTLEFSPRDSKPRLTGMTGGGPFGLEPGQWTDDTSMALALGDSLLTKHAPDMHDLMSRFVRWWRDGDYSCTGSCFDIGITTRDALSRFEENGNPLAGSTHEMSAGNGSLMRLAPAAIAGFPTGELGGVSVAGLQSRTTHGAAACIEACEAFAFRLYMAMTGKDRWYVFAFDGGNVSDPSIAQILKGSWRGRRRDDINSSGYVAHSLEAALWCVARTGNFRDAVLLAANLGDDADTTAAITGQLAGALYGRSGIPSEWLETVAWRDRIEGLAYNLYKRPGTGPVIHS